MMELIGCTRNVIQGEQAYRLPRATYFFAEGTLNRQTITSTWKSLETALKRRITIEVTEGPTWGIGLESPEPALTALSGLFTLKPSSSFDSWLTAGLLSKGS
jgi:hypothetical protein